MQKYTIIVFLFFAVATPVFSGCGLSKPSVEAAPAGAGSGKSNKRPPRSSSSTATSTGGERGRTDERTAGGKPRLFSPIRTDEEPGIEGMTTPGGTVHTKITGLRVLRGARSRIYTTDPTLRGGEFQDMWIDAYSLLLETVKLLEQMRENLNYKQTSLQEAARDHHLVSADLPTLTAAGIDKFNELHKQWLIIHAIAHDLAMKFYLGKRKLPSKPFFTQHPLQVALLLTIQLKCSTPTCSNVSLWDGNKRKLPFCHRQSLLVRQVQDLAAQDDFDYTRAQDNLTQLLMDTQTMHALLEQYLEKLMPTTRSTHFRCSHLVTMPAIR